jgi:hypothetical protein
VSEPILISNVGATATPKTYTLPAGLAFDPTAVTALFDGAGAASAFLACLSFYSSDGLLLARTFPAEQIVAGDSAEVTFSPFQAGGLTQPSQQLIGARLQALATQSIPNNTNTNLTYTDVLFDTDNMADLGADARILTVQTPGLYLVICETIFVPNATNRRINVIIRNDFYSSGSFPTEDHVSDGRQAITDAGARTNCLSVAIFQAEIGDFFSSGAFQLSGAALNANGLANCFFAALLIGA